MDEQKVQEFIVDLQHRGYSKFATTAEVKVEFELTQQKAYYRVRKYWNPPTQHSKKVRREMKAARVSVDA